MVNVWGVILSDVLNAIVNRRLVDIDREVRSTVAEAGWCKLPVVGSVGTEAGLVE